MKKNRIKIIAEAGVNHNGELQIAKELIDVAAEAGADIVKFQTFNADSLASKIAPKAEYQKATALDDENQWEMIKKLELKKDHHFLLKEYCDQKKIEFLSTPFDEESLNFLIKNKLIKRIKIPSGEITNTPFLIQLGRFDLPIIMSTGMSDIDEVRQGLSYLAFGHSGKEMSHLDKNNYNITYKGSQSWLQENVTILHCVSAYPAPLHQINLKAMDVLKNEFDLDVGFSDHSLGIEASLAAAARSARIIEKHFTLNKSMQGPDHSASLEPKELKMMVAMIRNIEKALGKCKKLPVESELHNRNIVRKSLVARSQIAKGDLFTDKNLTVKRPGNGISPSFYWDYIGKKADRDYLVDEVIQ